MANSLTDARKLHYKNVHANATRQLKEARRNLENEPQYAMALYWDNRIQYWQDVIEMCENECPELKG